MSDKIRLSKYINQSGFCSRREAEKKILAGLVSVNGIVVSDIVTFVTEEDAVEISGKKIEKNLDKIRVWVYYKMGSNVCTRFDPEGRVTIFSSIEKSFPNLPYLISVGRLDFNSEGLLLLTNNGEFARHLELPENGFQRKYLVKAYGKFSQEDIKKISSGIKINNIKYKKNTINLIKTNKSNSWFEVILTEGKNREIRKLFEYINLQVNRLIRTEYGPFKLGNLKLGEIKEIKNIDLKSLCK